MEKETGIKVTRVAMGTSTKRKMYDIAFSICNALGLSAKRLADELENTEGIRDFAKELSKELGQRTK